MTQKHYPIIDPEHGPYLPSKEICSLEKSKFCENLTSEEKGKSLRFGYNEKQQILMTYSDTTDEDAKGWWIFDQDVVANNFNKLQIGRRFYTEATNQPNSYPIAAPTEQNPNDPGQQIDCCLKGLACVGEHERSLCCYGSKENKSKHSPCKNHGNYRCKKLGE